MKKIQKKAKVDGGVHKLRRDSQDSQGSDNSNLTKIKDELPSDGDSIADGESFAASSAISHKLRDCLKNENSPFACMETNKGKP